jgi:hypothetical protein
VGLYTTATKHWLTNLSGVSAVVLCSLLALGQEVQVSPGKHSVRLTITAKSYRLLPTEEMQPTLTLECAVKGNKAGHLLLFSAGGAISEDNPETAPRNGQLTLTMTISGTKQATTWIPYGDTETYAYYGKTEPERLKFIEVLLHSPTASIQFKPFLTGQLIISEFDIGKLRDEAEKYPECGLK